MRLATTLKSHGTMLLSGKKIIENPEQTPEQSHEEWTMKKKQDGWQYGLIKDEKLMTHPAMVPYSDLSFEVKAKDYIFSEIVKELLAI